MAEAKTGTLVLRDGAGNYYLVTQETVERGRVAEEDKAEVERAIEAVQGGAGADDVEGHVLPLVAFAVGFSLGFVGVKAHRERVDQATAAHIYNLAARGGAPA